MVYNSKNYDADMSDIEIPLSDTKNLRLKIAFFNVMCHSN